MSNEPEHQHGQSHSSHEMPDHFPTREEFFGKADLESIAPAFNLDEVMLRLERHFDQVLESMVLLSPSDSTTLGIPKSRLTPFSVLSPFIRDLLLAVSRQRKDHRQMSATERAAFNDALQAAYADGSYQPLAAIHEDMSHHMHTIMGGGYIGGQRFLPWHRIYVLKVENLLRSKRPGLTVPYWNYAADRARPDWVWQPPNVTRNAPGNGATLPSQATVDNLTDNVVDYTGFATGVEFDAHNSVHNWCNGTITNPMTASRDPIFWLLHANVDRMWDKWQLKRSGQPDLTGTNLIMDPWTETVSDANSTVHLHYLYQ